ncbi:hypothetical protein C0993_006971, partial [Termitomyces sp. T159_Od127]
MSITEPPLTPEANDGTQDEVETQHGVDEEEPELWFETTQNNITTNGKGLRRTATPTGGWPKVYLAVSPSYNVAPDTLNKWEDLEEPTLWARLYRAKYEASVAGKMKTEDAIKNVIKNLINTQDDETIAVIFPEQDLLPEKENRFPHPYHLRIVGLTHTEARRLTELEVIASPEATVFFLPKDIPRQLYILTIKGLRYNDTTRAKELVENLVRNAFKESPEIRAIVETRATIPHEEAETRTYNICASFLPVKQRDDTIRCWNIYFAEDPGYDDESYKLLRKKMRACQFKTVGFGKGYTMTEDQPLCTGCKSADHDSYNCPFSRLPGWLGYKPDGPGDVAGTNEFADE